MEVSARHNISPLAYIVSSWPLMHMNFQINVCRRWPHSIILEKEGPNDGLVSVESSKWVSRLPLPGTSVCVARRALLNSSSASATGNVSRHAPGCESPRSSRVDQRGSVQLGAVSRARHCIPSGYVLPLHREPPRARGGQRAVRVRADRGGPVGRVL